MKKEDLQFNLTKFSTEANVGLKIFGVEKGLKLSLDKVEILIEKVKTPPFEINGDKAAYTTSISLGVGKYQD